MSLKKHKSYCQEYLKQINNGEGLFVTASGDTISITATSVSWFDGNAVRTYYWKQGVVNQGYYHHSNRCRQYKEKEKPLVSDRKTSSFQYRK